jgi:AraC family transcriptional regulator
MAKYMIQPEDLMTVEAQAQSEAAHVLLTRFHMADPLDDLLRIRDGFRLDLGLTPRPQNARARYTERWGPQRFERIGRLFLIRKGERLHARNEPGTGRTLACHFQPRAIESWFGDALEWTEPRLEASLDLRAPAVERLLLGMGEEVRHPGFAQPAMLDAMAVQLVIELRRCFNQLGPAQAAGGLAPWQLRVIDERLNDGPTTPRLSELAGLCGLSVRQLTRAFRVSRGCSIATYIAARRIAAAKQMLGQGQPIKSIAHGLGFASTSNFSYAFRAATGLSPRQFRAQFGARR